MSGYGKVGGGGISTYFNLFELITPHTHNEEGNNFLLFYPFPFPFDKELQIFGFSSG